MPGQAPAGQDPNSMQGSVDPGAQDPGMGGDMGAQDPGAQDPGMGGGMDAQDPGMGGDMGDGPDMGDDDGGDMDPELSKVISKLGLSDKDAVLKYAKSLVGEDDDEEGGMPMECKRYTKADFMKIYENFGGLDDDKRAPEKKNGQPLQHNNSKSPWKAKNPK